MAKTESIGPYLEPIRKSVTVNQTPEAAFDLFTSGIADWWPGDRYSVSQARIERVVLEPKPDGAVYEVRDDGQTFPWGKVLLWQPHERFVLSWHPGREPDEAQEVEVRFSKHANGTLVELEHRNWRGLGSEASVVRERYSGGWEEVLGRCYVNACNR